MPIVFVSHLKENNGQVQRLCNELTIRGVTVWLDRTDLLPGTSWKEAIRDAIRGGDFFLACFSAEYEERNRSYMNEELVLAIEELRLHSRQHPWFIPVLLSRCEIPNWDIGAGRALRDIQWVELYRDFNGGVRQILSIVQAERFGKLDSQGINSAGAAFDPEQADRLVNLLSSDQGASAALELIRIGALAVPALIDALSSNNGTTHGFAIIALKSIGEVAVPSLIEATSNKNPIVVRSAIRTLIEIGIGAVPVLIAALNRPELVTPVVYVLSEIGAPAVPALIQALDESDRRPAISATLTRIGEPAFYALLDAMSNGTQRQAEGASDALGLMGESVVPVLIGEFLRHPEKVSAAATLAKMGGKLKSKVVVDACAEIFGKQDEKVRWILKSIGTPEALDVIERFDQKEGR